ncbi:MAG TPA: S41 family peptidase [Bacteroidales bacterium]|nr:S41 family peptidase [Bacteroidales bacterium]
MDKNKLKIYLPLVYAGILLAGILLGLELSKVGNGISLFGRHRQEKINEVINYVKQNYVDTISRKQLEEKAITGMLQSLDPHSVYISPSEFHDANDPLLGGFEGIGVQFRLERDSITVINPVSGGPSEKLGIKAGDRIVKIDGKNVAGVKITNNDVLRKLKGKKGTKVNVSIFRKGVKGLLDYTIIRDVIPIYSLDVSYMVEPSIGYIRLNNFSATTHDEMTKALTDLNSKGMKKLILDLRGNGGGRLQAAIDIVDEFLPDGKLIVYTQGIHHAKETAYATAGGLFESGELVVLIDEWSASASEIVAGAIQDNDRGIIIGRRSFGKGLVQEELDFKDGSAIRVTIARYYTPSGRCIQKSYKNGSEDYYNDYYHRILSGEMENPDSIHFADSLKFKTPKGKTVYGGGGIMPDIYVPVGKDTLFKYFNLLANKGLIYQYAFDYTDKNRWTLNYRSFDEFNRKFEITNSMFFDFINSTLKSGIKREGKNLAASDVRIKVLIKAYIGRNILDNPGFYPLLNSIDETFLKAVSALKTGKPS